MVIDELIVRKGTTNMPIDSSNNQMIDEIEYEGNKYHFAKQKDLEGETYVETENAVAEPMRTLSIEGNTFQQTYNGKNLFDIANPLLAANSIITLNNYSPKFENDAMYNGGVVQITAGAYVCIETDRVSNYTISFNADFDEETQTIRQRRLMWADDIVDGVYISPKLSGYLSIAKGKNSIKISADGYRYIGFASYSSTQYGIKYTDFQIEKGDVATEYEPYVGGIASPNPEYPQEIETAKEPKVAIRGTNLFDIDNPLIISTNDYNISRDYIPKIEDGIIYNGGAYDYTDGASLCIKTDNKSVYTFSYNLEFDETTQTTISEGIYLYNQTGIDTSGVRTSRLFGPSANVKQGKNVRTINCQGYDYIGISWFGMSKYALQITDLQIEKGDVATEYEPYFNTTISIPPSVTLDDGTELELGFEKLGNYANKLVVDRVNNKVEYVRNCRTIKYVTQWADVANFDKTEDVQQFNMAFPNSLRSQSKDIAKCSHLPYNHNSYRGDEIGFTLLGGTSTSSSTYVVPRSILIPFGFVAGTKSTYTPAFKAWLQDQNEKGTPFTVCAVVEPQTFDLTNTELGAKLLEFAKTGKGKNVVEITSKLPVSKTELSYWRQIIPNE